MSTSARNRSPWLALFLAGCGGEQERRAAEPQPKRTQAPAVAVAQPQASEEAEPEAASPGEPQGAADVLRQYYDLIAGKRYQDALRFRDTAGRALTATELAAAFDHYGEHKVTVGTPSPVIEGGEWLYVEVPVQRYGKYKAGTAFGSAGTVTLRRRKSGGNQDWRIVTS